MKRTIVEELWFTVSAIRKVNEHNVIDYLKTYTKERYTSLERCQELLEKYTKQFEEDKEKYSTCDSMVSFRTAWENSEITVLPVWEAHIEKTEEPKFIKFTEPKICSNIEKEYNFYQNF